MRVLRIARFWLLDYVFAVRALAAAARRGDPAELYLPAGSSPRAPVLILPGVWETWRFLRPTIALLHDRGHPVHVLNDLGRNAGAVAAAAEVAAAYLRAHDLRHVVVVAHSKGGLIGKHAMAFDDPEGRIDRMIAISAPFSGSRWATFLPLPSLHAFAPRDPTIARLARDHAVNDRITSVWAEFDPHIPGGSALAGATNVRIPEVGHFRILATDALHRALEQALEAPPGRRGAASPADASSSGRPPQPDPGRSPRTGAAP